MKQFTDIQLATFLNGPAGVDLDTGILYLNPFVWSKLGDNARKFVIAHELGHLNQNHVSEYAADKFALWKNMQMGEDSIAALRGFYEAMPFSTAEQKDRGEALLLQVFQKEFDSGNTHVEGMISLLNTPVENIQTATGLAGWLAIGGAVLGSIIPGVGTALGAGAGAAVGTAISSGVAANKSKKEQEKTTDEQKQRVAAKEAEQARLLELQRYELEQQQQQQIHQKQTESTQKIQSKSKYKIIVIIMVLISIASFIWYKLKK